MDYDSPVYGETLTPKKYLDWFWDALEASEQHTSDWRETARDLYLLYASQSWKEEDRRWLEKTHRVPIEANLILSTVEAIVGSDLMARQEVQYDPQQTDELAQQVKGDMLTHLGRVFREKCEGHTLDSRALFDMLVTGYGWGSSYLDASLTPMLPRYDVPNPLEMFPDPEATDDNLRDAQYVIRKRRIRLEHAQAMWPDKKEVLEELAEMDHRAGRTLGASIASAFRGGFGAAGGRGLSDREVWVYEHQYYRMVPTVHFTDPMTGEDRSLPESDFDKYVRQIAAKPGALYMQPKRQYWRSFLSSTRKGKGEEEILSQKPVGKVDTFLAQAMTGYRRVVDEGRRVVFFGIVEVGADGQRLINRTISAVLDFLARAVKGGADVEEGALPEGMTLEQYAQQRSMTGGYALVGEDAIAEGRIKHYQPPQWPTGFEKMFDMLVGIHDQTTVGGHFRGQLSPKTGDSSKAFDAANVQTQVVLARLMENLRSWRERVGKTQAALALREMPRVDLEPFVSSFQVEGVTFLTEQDPVTQEPFQTPLVNHPLDLLLDEDPFSWSVIVDTGAASPSAKQQAFSMWMNGLLSTFQEAGMPPQVMLDPLLDVAPFPRTTVQKMRRAMREHQEQSQQIQTLEQMDVVLSQMSEEEQFQALAWLAQRYNLPLLPAGQDEGGEGLPVQ